MSGERCVCSTCGREVGAVVPRGGDGSEVRPRPHNGPDGNRCGGRHYEAEPVAGAAGYLAPGLRDSPTVIRLDLSLKVYGPNDAALDEFARGVRDLALDLGVGLVLLEASREAVE